MGQIASTPRGFVKFLRDALGLKICFINVILPDSLPDDGAGLRLATLLNQIPTDLPAIGPIRTAASGGSHLIDANSGQKPSVEVGSSELSI